MIVFTYKEDLPYIFDKFKPVKYEHYYLINLDMYAHNELVVELIETCFKRLFIEYWFEDNEWFEIEDENFLEFLIESFHRH